MNPGRRRLLGGLAVLLVLPAIRPASAQTSDLVVLCDKALGPALSTVGAAYRSRTGVRIVVFPTTPALILPQLMRQVQNDIVVTQLGILAAAVEAGVVARDSYAGRWRNRLVVATGRSGAIAATDTPFAVPDAPIAAGVDGRDVLGAAGIRPGSLRGVLDTSAVAFQLTSGTASAGLVLATEVSANAGLRVLQPIGDGLYPPIVYSAAITKLTRRGDPAAFMAFLASPAVRGLLTGGGLEVSA